MLCKLCTCCICGCTVHSPPSRSWQRCNLERHANQGNGTLHPTHKNRCKLELEPRWLEPKWTSLSQMLAMNIVGRTSRRLAGGFLQATETSPDSKKKITNRQGLMNAWSSNCSSSNGFGPTLTTMTKLSVCRLTPRPRRSCRQVSPRPFVEPPIYFRVNRVVIFCCTRTETEKHITTVVSPCWSTTPNHASTEHEVTIRPTGSILCRV